ncbi:O-antigen polysaccharide polymerase Wzy family protein [Carnobacterium divergens]|uniref:Uncharacterized protein n=1 Tax=Carnobacterium divergens TaxID=2748 RepID=A0A2R7ZZM8_CARDV|nr:O-antigen polysaccharide polymerase Wzy family protein [Carnobacterium divergens]MCO6018216.1 O-antigen polysaccharide polymerase Wzy family protein [Carnobacterium divergens]MPQ21939.1 O-antigen polysaccharide polymerase Wzy [Carnobacterium divergens]TFI64651.1 hypothetical protein CKN62_02490 [Carnobacterium divergens]TFI75031.1 hypothetical protein CKN58_01960 [Carnobacterium divergens]TFI79394.1 hypothetical protein CKN85_01960 [Carnobacterium divergens]
MKKTYFFNAIYLLLAIVVFVMGLIFDSTLLELTAVLIVLFNNVSYSISNFNKNVIFFCFNCTFFIFLIGRIFVSTFFNYRSTERGTYGLDFVDSSYVHLTMTCLFLSLIFVFLGYVIVQKIKIPYVSKITISNDYNKALENAALIFFYISISFRLIIVWQMRNTAISEGYFETFTTFKSSLPGVLQNVSNMYDIAYFAFLATYPTKRKVLLPTSLYLLEGIIASMGGRRSILMLNILIVFIYFVIRNIGIVNKKEKWIGKFEVLASLISVPILMSLMTIIGNVRASFTEKTATANSGDFINSLKEFLYSQGVSANLIGYTEMYRDQLPHKIYTLGPVIEFIDNNIFRKLKGLPEFTGQSIDRAINGHLYSQALPYLIMPVAYLKGYGYGSSFIAENYADFSFLGVIIGSFLYGCLLHILFVAIKSNKFIIVTFALLMTRTILFAPRAAYLSFIVSSLSPIKIVTIVLIIIFAKIIKIKDE